MSHLPVHQYTGLTAIGWRRNGDPIWPVMGAAPEDDDPDPDGDPSGEPDDKPSGDDDPDDDEGADQLGDPGKKALDRMKDRLRTERQARRKAEQERDELKSKGGKPDGDGQPDADTIRQQARDEARTEALRGRVLDKIEAKAGRKFADAEDAAAVLLRTREVDEFIADGKVDADAIADALDELAEAKPHLLAQPTTTAGQFDSGRGKKADKGQLTRDDLKKMTPAQIEAARKAGKLDKLLGRTK